MNLVFVRKLQNPRHTNCHSHAARCGGADGAEGAARVHSHDGLEVAGGADALDAEAFDLLAGRGAAGVAQAAARCQERERETGQRERRVNIGERRARCRVQRAPCVPTHRRASG